MESLLSATHIQHRGEPSLLAEVVVSLGLLDFLLEQVWVDQLDTLIVRHCHRRDQTGVHTLRGGEARAPSRVIHLGGEAEFSL